MSDSEEDYMSDKVLMGCVKEDIRPGLLFSTQEKRKLDLYKKNQELMSKKPKTYKEQELEAREKGLSTAISEENKGFKMLAKMGFKAGESLGKSQIGIKEPINVIVKKGTAGVGKKDHQKTAQLEKIDNAKLLDEKLKDFRASKFQEGIQKQIERDLCLAQKICEELDYSNNIKIPIQEFYWRFDTIKKMKAAEKKDDETDEESDDDDDDDEQEYDELKEDKLFTIINYLREKYLYCIYCSITGVDENDLNSYCPGPYRLNHNDDES